jgi:hypothetical protein
MVLLQSFQKFVETKIEKKEFTMWIDSTNPVDRLNCLLNNLENYYNVKWITFENILGIKLK